MCKTPRKHADLIKAWADGAEIQYRLRGTNYWYIAETPSWSEGCDYRIKPEPKPDVVSYSHIRGIGSHRCPEVVCSSAHNWNEEAGPAYTKRANVKFTFDGETGNLKAAEVI